MTAAKTAADRPETEQLYEQFYEQYGKPLEAEHRSAYLAISPEGKTLLGKTLVEVTHRATELFGPGNFVYKVGEKAVGRWR